MSKRPAVFDLETDPFLHGREPLPFVWGYYDGTEYYSNWFDDITLTREENARECIKSFIEFCSTLDVEEIVIYAHNGGKFDFHYLIEWLDENIMVLNGRLAKVSIKGLEFRDSLLMLPRPLSAYKKDEIDYKIFERKQRNKPKNKILIEEYLKTDCIYLYEWITKFIDLYGYYLTLPAASFNQLKLTGYEPQHTYLDYDDHFREFYYGGRTEAFKPGITLEDCEYVDINSAYPFAMMDFHPYGNKYIELDKPPEKGMYFADITAISKGALPYRDTGELTGVEVLEASIELLKVGNLDNTKAVKNKGLYFPNDDIPRQYSVTSWEIEAGLETGTLEIISYDYIVQHEQHKNFKEFVDKFYELKSTSKANGDKDSETFAKLILNSCYGKFATNSRLFKTYQIVPVGCLPTELVEYYIKYKVDNIKSLHEAIIMDDELRDKEAQNKANMVLTWVVSSDLPCGLTIWERDEPSDRFYNVATAASITGYVRAMLWKAICESDMPIYCDTDSIMCKHFYGSIGDKLGQWEQEAILNKIYVGGKKLYAAHIKGKSLTNENGWKTASKGSRLTHNQIVSEVENRQKLGLEYFDENITGTNWQNSAPSFSLRYGARFVDRNIKCTV